MIYYETNKESMFLLETVSTFRSTASNRIGQTLNFNFQNRQSSGICLIKSSDPELLAQSNFITLKTKATLIKLSIKEGIYIIYDWLP